MLRYVKTVFQTLVLSLFHGHVHDVVHYGRKAVFYRYELHLAGLYLGQIQYIVDKGEQGLACTLDVQGIFPDRLTGRGAKYHLVHTYDGIHGSPDLMGHIGEEIALGLVGCVRCILLELQDLPVISSLLLLELHLLQAPGVVLFISVTGLIQYGDHEKDQDAYHNHDDQLALHIRIQLGITEHHDHMPAVDDAVHIDCTLLTVEDVWEAAGSGLFYGVHVFDPVICIRQAGAPFCFVGVGNDETGIIHDEAVSLAVEIQLVHHGLYLAELDIERDDILPVGEHAADGYDHVAGLGIDVGRDKDHCAFSLFCGGVPVPCGGIEARGRLPVETVYVFIHYVSVQAGIVLVELVGYIIGLIDQEFMYPGLCGTADQHVMYGVGSDMQHVFRSIQVILYQRGYVQYPVLDDSVGIGHRHAVEQLRGVDHHNRHEHKYEYQRYDGTVFFSFLFCVCCGHDSSCHLRVRYSPGTSTDVVPI